MVLKLFFDGCCNNMGNPPMMGIGVAALVNDIEAEELHYKECTGIGTSNVAEWQALVKALEIAIDFCEKNPGSWVRIYGDSQLVVNQFKGIWECKKRHLQVYHNQAVNLREQLGKCLVSVGWVKRDYNKLADRLSKQAVIG